MRDMSEKQFLAALASHGMRPEGFLGYVDLNVPGQHISASMFNGGVKKRDRLAYLLKQREKHIEEREAKAIVGEAIGGAS